MFRQISSKPTLPRSRCLSACPHPAHKAVAKLRPMPPRSSNLIDAVMECYRNHGGRLITRHPRPISPPTADASEAKQRLSLPPLPDIQRRHTHPQPAAPPHRRQPHLATRHHQTGGACEGDAASTQHPTQSLPPFGLNLEGRHLLLWPNGSATSHWLYTFQSARKSTV